MVSQAKKDQYTRPFTPSGTADANTQVLTADQYRGGTSRLLWKWNETSTSEIGTRVVPCTLNPGAITSDVRTFIAAGASNGIGPRIQFNITMGAGGVSTNAGLWPILSAAGSAITVPNRFVMRYRIASVLPTGMNAAFFGMGLWNGSTATPYGVSVLQHSTANATGIVRLQASDAASATRPYLIQLTTHAGASVVSTNINSMSGASYDLEYIIDPATVTTPPLPMCTMMGAAGYGISTQTPSTVVVANRSNPGSAFLTTTGVIDAGWNNRVINQLCLMFIGATAGGGGVKNIIWRISDMAIFKHPLDEGT